MRSGLCLAPVGEGRTAWGGDKRARRKEHLFRRNSRLSRTIEIYNKSFLSDSSIMLRYGAGTLNPGSQDAHPNSAMDQLCGLGLVAWTLWASVFSSVKWG